MSHPPAVQTPLSRAPGWQPLLLSIVDLALGATLIVTPFLMGGQEPVGQLALCVLSTTAALFWCLYQCCQRDRRWRATGIEPIMLLGLGLVLLQCWELTPELIRALSPSVSRLLSEWNSDSILFSSSWKRISFTPFETWSSFVSLVASIQFFVVLSQRLRTIDDSLKFVRLVAAGGTVMAAFGLVQLVWGNGKFYWFYEHPLITTSHVAQGPFLNPDNFACYLALLLPAQLLALIDGVVTRESALPFNSTLRPARRRIDWSLIGWSLCLAVTAAGIVFSRSSAGLTSAVLGMLLCLLIFWRKSLLSFRQAMLSTVGMIAVLLVIPAVNRPVAPVPLPTGNVPHLGTVAASSSLQMDHWKANFGGISEFPLAGTGLGSHEEVFGLWFQTTENGFRKELKNGYMQLALETGLTGLGLVILLWLTSLLWCAQGLWNSISARSGGLMAVVTSGLFMSLVQSGFEPVWYVPACVNIVLLYGVVAWRISLMRFFEPVDQLVARKQGKRIGWIVAIPCVLLLGQWMVRENLPELAAQPIWNDYLRLTHAQRQSGQPEKELSRSVIEKRIELAKAASVKNPRSHEVQLHAGLACLKEFTLRQESSQRHMPLSQIRDAARTLFESAEEMNQWLDRPGVLGEDRQLLNEAMEHFQASLEACPLQPRPYLELAELVWLDGGTEADERDLVEQAVVVRPGDARSHFAMGRLLWLEGSQKEAAVYWQNAFRVDPDYRSQLIGVLAEYVPARFFLDQFEPDLAALKQLRSAYKLSDDTLGYQLILDNLARAAVKKAILQRGEAAANEWMLAHECYAELNDRKNAYHTAKEAVTSAPELYQPHQVFGMWLYRNGFYSDAIRELDWCMTNRPSEIWLETFISLAKEHVRTQAGQGKYAEQPGNPTIR